MEKKLLFVFLGLIVLFVILFDQGLLQKPTTDYLTGHTTKIVKTGQAVETDQAKEAGNVKEMSQTKSIEQITEEKKSELDKKLKAVRNALEKLCKEKQDEEEKETCLKNLNILP